MLNPQDLQRVSAEKAAAVLVLCNKFSSDPSKNILSLANVLCISRKESRLLSLNREPIVRTFVDFYTIFIECFSKYSLQNLALILPSLSYNLITEIKR